MRTDAPHADAPHTASSDEAPAHAFVRARRARRLFAVGAFVALFGVVPTALAELALVFEPPERVVVGDRARLVLVVDVATDVPVLVTPTHEGSAIEVVRGRLARADAVEPNARPLRFPIPIVARERGTGVVRATVTSFVCEGEVCDAVEEEARVAIRVEER
ncbi:MAG: hypothetical protein MUE69_33920 [Myxococcota bacterium]|jgi:hypothetical protein|nr:hypothetical protein [Myxococcota bacterium]